MFLFFSSQGNHHHFLFLPRTWLSKKILALASISREFYFNFIILQPKMFGNQHRKQRSTILRIKATAVNWPSIVDHRSEEILRLDLFWMNLIYIHQREFQRDFSKNSNHIQSLLLLGIVRQINNFWLNNFSIIPFVIFWNYEARPGSNNWVRILDSLFLLYCLFLLYVQFLHSRNIEWCFEWLARSFCATPASAAVWNPLHVN